MPAGFQGRAGHYDRLSRGIIAHSVKAALDRLSGSDDTLMTTMQERTQNSMPSKDQLSTHGSAGGGPGTSSSGSGKPNEASETGGIIDIELVFNNMYDFARVNSE